MLDPVLNLAIFIIWWWISLFIMLPIGVRSLGEDVAPAQARTGGGDGASGPADPVEANRGAAHRGHDLGAPVAPNLWRKALWAALAAVVLWAATATFVHFDPFHVRPDLLR